MKTEKSIGAQILELLPKNLHEDLFEEVKTILIEKGEVKEVVKEKPLTPAEKLKAKEAEQAKVKEIVNGLI